MERPVGTVERPKTRAESFGRDELERELIFGGITPFEAPLIAMYRGPVRPRAGVMGVATLAWFALVFGLCYVGLPAFAELTGLHRGLLSTAPVAAVSFAATAGVTAVAAAAIRPTLDAARDPVLAATLGGLGTWAVVHNVTPYLRPFWDMTLVELGTFLSFNVLEMFLVGAMLASLTRSRLAAFGLGVGWQVVSLGLFLTLWALLVG
jgi:hypothetical protein